MASFEKKAGDSPKSSSNDGGQKLPLKRFEPAISRFTKVAIPMDMSRLERHKYNLEKYKKWRSWSKLDIEKNNSERTIKQLKANIHDMNVIRTQVSENDVGAFDEKVKHLADKALYEINSLRKLIEDCEEARNEDTEETNNISSNSSDTDMLPLSPSQAALFNSSDVSSKADHNAKSTTQQSLSRFEVTLHTFTKITIPTALDTLRMHCQNMEKFYGQRLWDQLNSEQVNAAITVKHLKRNIQDIEMTRRQVPLYGLNRFDDRIGPSHEQALTSIGSFMKFQEKYKNISNIECKESGGSGEDNETALLTDKQLQRQQETPGETTLHSWDDLQASLVELNELIHDFSRLVDEQHSAVDTITSNIEHAQVNVQDGTRELGKAAKLQGLLLPALGALVGGVVGGPVGMLAGFKSVAVLTAVGGGVLGFGATNYIKHQREETIDQELEKLVDGNSENQS